MSELASDSTRMNDCLFCGIVEGTVPSTAVMETEGTYAFADLEPVAPVHVLVIPKVHVANAAEVTADHAGLLVEMLATARAVAISEGIAEAGYRLVFNVGEDAGNSVAHLHLHVVGGRSLGWPPG